MRLGKRLRGDIRMIIENFYMVAIYLGIYYTLLCVGFKMLYDFIKKLKMQENQRLIKAFFANGGSSSEPETAKRILRLVKDDLLFDYICECYTSSRSDYSEKINAEMTAYIKRVFCGKIKHIGRGDIAKRSLILSNISKTGITSPEIESFVRRCAGKSQIEKIWAEEIAQSKKDECKVG